MNTPEEVIHHIALANTLHEHFDYLYHQAVPIGSRVIVPFRQKNRLGIVVNHANQTTIERDKLRNIEKIIDNQDLLPDEIQKLCAWTSDYYQASLGDVLFTALPVLLRNLESGSEHDQTAWQISNELHEIDLSKLPKSSCTAKQLQLLQCLQAETAGLCQDQIQDMGFSSATIAGLAKRNLILKTQASEQTWLNTNSSDNKQSQPSKDLNLNAEQQFAVTSILEQKHSFKCHLLQGITGSGKTEVYFHLLKDCLQRGKRCLILVPEIGLTPQLYQRIVDRFSQTVAVTHSGLNTKARLNAWLAAQRGTADIIIGTRSAIFTPIPDLGLIIVDEEHDQSFKQQEGVRYHAKDCAIMRAKIQNIPIVLGSATPSLETLNNAISGKFKHYYLTKRATNAKPPQYSLIDIRSQRLHSGIAPQMLEKIRQHLALDQQVMIFINRRGYAPVLMCHQCGWSADCENCDAHLTLHGKPTYLMCHYCDKRYPLFNACPKCNSTSLMQLGTGTERIDEYLSEQFPDTAIVRIDRDSTTRKGSLENKLASINSGKAKLLIGTQMLAKGHHFPELTLVGIINADSGFYSSDFRAIERFGQLLTQVAGRAGRAKKLGEVVIQTHVPHHPLLQRLIDEHAGFDSFAEHLLTERQQSSLPPFAYLTLIRAKSKNKNMLYQFLNKIKGIAYITQQDVYIAGPVPAPMERRANTWHAQLLIKHQQRAVLHRMLRSIYPKFITLPETKMLSWSIDVDPIDLAG